MNLLQDVIRLTENLHSPDLILVEDNSFVIEFLNRIDDIVVFHGLSPEDLESIVRIQLERLKGRLAERHIVLELSPAALRHFAEIGYDPVYGARPLKRLLQREIETTLARRILAGEVVDHSTVEVDWNGSELTFDASPLEAAA